MPTVRVEDMMEHLLYVPLYPGMNQDAIVRLGRIVSEFEGARGATVAVG